jgi:hypothetical protein
MSWSEPARISAIALMTGEERQDDSVTATLIRDISAVFADHDDEPLKTADLLEGLYEIEESPWGDWFGRPLSAHGLSKLLKPYRVKTMPVWNESKTVRGYKVEQFLGAFAQLSVRSVRSVRSECPSQNPLTLPNAPNASENKALGSVRPNTALGAEPNAPNAPNASTREQGGENGRPLVGDEGYLEAIIAAKRAGFISEQEWREQALLHRLVRKAREA